MSGDRGQRGGMLREYGNNGRQGSQGSLSGRQHRLPRRHQDPLQRHQHPRLGLHSQEAQPTHAHSNYRPGRGGVDLQKFLFHTVQVVQNCNLYSTEAILHLLRDTWLVLNQGYFRQSRRRIIPPDPRDYVSAKETRYIIFLGQKLARAFGVLLKSISESQRRAIGNINIKFNRLADSKRGTPDNEREKHRRLHTLVSMILVLICHKSQGAKHLCSTLTENILAHVNNYWQGNREEEEDDKGYRSPEMEDEPNANAQGSAGKAGADGGKDDDNAKDEKRSETREGVKKRSPGGGGTGKRPDPNRYVVSAAMRLHSRRLRLNVTLSRCKLKDVHKLHMSMMDTIAQQERLMISPTSSPPASPSLSLSASWGSVATLVGGPQYGDHPQYQSPQKNRTQTPSSSRQEAEGQEPSGSSPAIAFGFLGESTLPSMSGMFGTAQLTSSAASTTKPERVYVNFANADKKLSNRLAALCVMGRLSNIRGSHRLFKVHPKMEQILIKTMRQTHAKVQDRRVKRKGWSMMNFFGISSQSSNTNDVKVSILGENEEEEVDTILIDHEAVRAGIKGKVRKMVRFEANMKTMRLMIPVLEAWMRGACLNNHERAQRRDSRSQKTDIKSGAGGSGDRPAGKGVRRDQAAVRVRSQAELHQAQGHLRGESGVGGSGRTATANGTAGDAKKGTEGEKRIGSLTKNQQNVFRRLSLHMQGRGQNSRAQKMNLFCKHYGENFANALTIFCIRTVQQTEAMVKREMRLVQKDVWKNLPYNFSKAEVDRGEFKVAAAISAIKLLSLNCSLAGAHALPLRVALLLESLSSVLTEMLSGPDFAGDFDKVCKHGNIVLSVIDFFIAHPSPTYDVKPLITLFFSHCLSKVYMEPLMAYSSVQFVVNNRNTILKDHILKFFPLLFKIFAMYPITFVEEFQTLIRFLAIHDGIQRELLHAILDLPFLAVLVQVHKKIGIRPEGWDSFLLHKTSNEILVYKYMLRNKSSSIERPNAKVMKSCRKRGPFTTFSPAGKALPNVHKHRKVELARELVPTLLNIYFDYMLQTITISESKHVLQAIIERYDPRDATPQLCDRLLAILEKYPLLIIHSKTILLSTIRSSATAGLLSPSSASVRRHLREGPDDRVPRLHTHIIWAIGEYLQTKEMPVDFEIVLEYQRALAQVVEAQIQVFRLLSQSPSTSDAVSPPIVLLSLIEGDGTTSNSNHNASHSSSQNRRQHRHSGNENAGIGSINPGGSGADSKQNSFDPEFTARLIHVSLTALCKLAARCVEIVPSVRGVLIYVLGSSDVLPPSVSLRASQCARLLQLPSIAYSLFRDPFIRCSNLTENTSVALLTNLPSESDFVTTPYPVKGNL